MMYMSDSLVLEKIRFSSKTCTRINYVIRAPAAIARQILSTVAKNSNSTEHFVNLNADYLHSVRMLGIGFEI